MEQIILKPLRHHDEECIGIYVAANIKAITVLNRKAGAKWSRTNRCWSIPISLESMIPAAKEKAGIQKTDSMRMLRHTFAPTYSPKGRMLFLYKNYWVTTTSKQHLGICM